MYNMYIITIIIIMIIITMIIIIIINNNNINIYIYTVNYLINNPSNEILIFGKPQ